MTRAAGSEMAARPVLVRLGHHSRVVEFSSNDDLKTAIFRVFSDVPRVANASTLVLQLKSSEWGGEFVDLREGQAIPDRSVLNVIPVVGSPFFLLFNIKRLHSN